MKDRIVTVSGIMLFWIIILGILYVNLSDSSETEVYTEIILKGNHLQSIEGYLIGADLNKSVEYPDLTLLEIKRRILSHPYVAGAEVKSNGKGVVEINLVEKDFMAVLLTGKKPVLITGNFEIINMKMNSDISGLPVISNSSIREIDEEDEDLKSDELVRAFTIIDAARILDKNIYDSLTEINLRHGQDVVLSFTGINCPVIIGKGSEVKKVFLLSSIWSEMKKNEKLFSNSTYVDLRFNNEIFIGKPVKTDNNG